jgi:hypothetical protein
MAMTEPFTDRELRCEVCGKRFIWTAQGQLAYSDRGYFVPPGQCRPCRRERARRKAAACRQALLDGLEIEFDVAMRSRI